jgi:hypothetical protein
VGVLAKESKEVVSGDFESKCLGASIKLKRKFYSEREGLDLRAVDRETERTDMIA